MVDYKKMYLTLFNATEDAINTMENVIQSLIQAQRECEELYISGQDQEEDGAAAAAAT